ncbi:conserved hypothetical protein [Candidatus Glomeribacter gigasporarum BEG34]|uniref:Phytanoyl-CoA dioxygenase n=1 Tax=Candidatus Glomeribacter gigasporarum BEG34 TaxID=1070319 RepID=G2JBP5_9BURK|nr:phytanoyl-CoA dioxygenase family protein [Candidatus Glomeribacter gigasporarum]CCD30200.1 conserved hypothetical protein [Candidatus Glomeribacter gigasporarum BEG34]
MLEYYGDSTYLEGLKETGFFLIQNFLQQNEIKALKDVAVRIFNVDGGSAVLPTIFLKENKLTEIFFHKRMRSFLQDIFGYMNRIYLYPNITIRNNLYVNWHTDDFFLAENLQDEGALPEFYMFNVYLQDNSKERGGGIDVMSGTHHLGREKKDKIISCPAESTYYSIPSKSGDLIVFDYRIIHRGTIPTVDSNPDRFALQWTVSTSDKWSSMYLAYLLSRGKQKIHLADFTPQRAKTFFEDISNVVYPDSFDDVGRAFFDQYIRFIDTAHYIVS